ncbi:MAG: hypothetical protein FJ053_05160 [Cyanobacteria bacterium M_surface_10_m1_298]|nr:hypothetical protein [Cyanobacteria bacterium M_surface_10_m1_298]
MRLAALTRIKTRHALAVLWLWGVAAQAQTPQELKAYEQRLQQLFQQLDRNSNQRLERQEVQGHPYLERHFERLDQQQRGFLAPADLKPGRPSAEERSERFLRKADQNRDGRVDRQEAQRFPWLQRQFNAVDRNGDGSVERSELQEWAHQRRQANPSGSGQR